MWTILRSRRKFVQSLDGLDLYGHFMKDEIAALSRVLEAEHYERVDYGFINFNVQIS